MSCSTITMKEAYWDPTEWNWDVDSKNNIYTLKNNAKITLLINKNKINAKYTFKFQKGFKCDGLSVPKAFQWFLKRWDDKNMLYNLAGVVHDGLYGNKGFKTFTRDDADAIFRGILRESGCNRFHASTADFALGLAAKSHWGDDSLNCAKLVTMSIEL